MLKERLLTIKKGKGRIRLLIQPLVFIRTGKFWPRLVMGPSKGYPVSPVARFVATLSLVPSY